MSKKDICYILQSRKKRSDTYVGITNNFAHRIKQHNGVIKCKTRYTKRNRPWDWVIHVQGFETRQQAAQFEYAMKKKESGKWIKGSVHDFGKNV